MRICISGANGRLGRFLVDQALAAGYTVTAIVRSRSSLTLTHPLLTVAEAHLNEPASLGKAIAGHDAVLVAIAPKVKLLQKTQMMSDAAGSLSRAMQEIEVSRIIWVTSAGLEPAYVRAKSFFYRFLVRPFFLARIYADFAASEQVVKATALEWVIVRPSRLTNGPIRKTYRVQVNSTPRMRRRSLEPMWPTSCSIRQANEGTPGRRSF